MPARLSFCANAYTAHPLPEALRRIRAVGYEGCELLFDAPHWWPPRAEAAKLRQLQELCGELGLAVVNLNANTACGHYREPIPENVFGPALTDADPARRRLRRDHLMAAIEVAAALGCPSVAFTTGQVGDDCPPARALERLHGELPPLLRAAQDAGVRLGVEAEPGLLHERSDEVAALVDELQHPALGFNLDVGHAVVMGEDPAAVVAAHHARIWHLHLEDIAGRKHFHLPPGEGDVDFAGVAAALARAGWDGWASVELYPYKSDPDRVARLALERLGPLFAPAAGR